MLLGVAFTWGCTFPLISSALKAIDPQSFLAARFTLASLLFLPWVRLRRDTVAGLFWGAILGLVAFGAYELQTLGLELIPASRAAFITGSSVALVPVLGVLFGQGLPSRRAIGLSALALLGLGAVTGAGFRAPSVGDAYVGGCAVLFAAHVHLIHVARRWTADVLHLTFGQTSTVAVLCAWIVAGTDAPVAPLADREVAAAVAFCAVAATVGAFWLQARFQRDTTPDRAALIYSTEPVFAYALGFAYLGERLSPSASVGAVLILISAAAPGGRGSGRSDRRAT